MKEEGLQLKKEVSNERRRPPVKERGLQLKKKVPVKEEGLQ